MTLIPEAPPVEREYETDELESTEYDNTEEE
jgi:hypothetical protein